MAYFADCGRHDKPGRMHLSKHDLFQMDDEWLKGLPAERLLEVSKRLLHDVKELQDRLNQNPSNSSRLPTSQAPWEKSGGPVEKEGAPAKTGRADATGEPLNESTQDTEGSVQAEAKRPTAKKGSGKRPGRQPGSPGHGRFPATSATAPALKRAPAPSPCSPASSKPAGVAALPPGSTWAPSSPPLARALHSPRSRPSRLRYRGGE